MVSSRSLREHLCRAVRPFAQLCNWQVKRAPPTIIPRADQARIMDRRKGRGRLPKSVHPDPFFADAHGLPFASPYARAELLVSLSAQPAVCPPCFKTSKGPD